MKRIFSKTRFLLCVRRQNVPNLVRTRRFKVGASSPSDLCIADPSMVAPPLCCAAWKISMKKHLKTIPMPKYLDLLISWLALHLLILPPLCRRNVFSLYYQPPQNPQVTLLDSGCCLFILVHPGSCGKRGDASRDGGQSFPDGEDQRGRKCSEENWSETGQSTSCGYDHCETDNAWFSTRRFTYKLFSAVPWTPDKVSESINDTILVLEQIVRQEKTLEKKIPLLVCNASQSEHPELEVKSSKKKFEAHHQILSPLLSIVSPMPTPDHQKRKKGNKLRQQTEDHVSCIRFHRENKTKKRQKRINPRPSGQCYMQM